MNKKLLNLQLENLGYYTYNLQYEPINDNIIKIINKFNKKQVNIELNNACKYSMEYWNYYLIKKMYKLQIIPICQCKSGYITDKILFIDNSDKTCLNNCTNNCTNNSLDSCTNNCLDNCTYNCLDNCTNNYVDSCSDNCLDNCTNNCLDNCTNNCLYNCTNNCLNNCSNNCLNNCSK